MLTEERQRQILELLKVRQSVTVAFLSRNLYASEATIRRDLNQMSQRGLLRRLRGGAALLEGINNDAPLLVRAALNRERKERIACLALELIRNSSAIFMDSSSTVTALAEKLDRFHNLSVVTNGLVTLNTLNEFPAVKLICSGGLLQNNASFVGQLAEEAFRSRRAELAFFSCCGLSGEFGASEAREETASLKRAMLRGAKKRVLLCDRTKVGEDYFCRSCGLEEIDVLVTDQAPPPELEQAFREKSPQGQIIWR